MGDQGLRLDSHGRPHVAYVGDFVYYAWYDGTDWHTEVVADGTVIGTYGYVAPPSLDLDDQDMPHLVYLDSAGTTLLYAWRTTAAGRRERLTPSLSGVYPKQTHRCIWTRTGIPRSPT